MKKIKLSVVLAVYNEEANLARCLESVKDIAGEIVIVDGGSTDKTVEIAKRFKAKIIRTDNPPNFHINKNKAIDAAAGEWILQLDADEVVSPELSREIKSITYNLKPNHYAGYWLNRKNWFLDRFLTKGGQYPDPTLRLYRRGMGRLPAIDVHEQATFIAEQLRQQEIHFNLSNVFLYLCFKPLSTFLKIYFRHRGYVDGFPGLVFALYSGLVHPVSFIKFWQKTFYPDQYSKKL